MGVRDRLEEMVVGGEAIRTWDAKLCDGHLADVDLRLLTSFWPGGRWHWLTRVIRNIETILQLAAHVNFVHFLKETIVFFKLFPNLEFKSFHLCFYQLKILEIFINFWSDPFQTIQKAFDIMNFYFSWKLLFPLNILWSVSQL